MANSRTGSPELPQPRFWVIYGTSRPMSLQKVSLPRFHQILLTEYEEETSELFEPWRPMMNEVRERRQQNMLANATFPFVAAGVSSTSTKLPNEREAPEEQQLFGAVILSFTYDVVREDEKRTTRNRKQLHAQLLNTPLLGPSILLITKVPGKCKVNVLIAVGTMTSCVKITQLITDYLYLAHPEVPLEKFIGTEPTVSTFYKFGFDPLAYLRPRPVEGYTTFPVELAQARIAERIQERKAYNRQRFAEEEARKQAARRARQ